MTLLPPRNERRGLDQVCKPKVAGSIPARSIITIGNHAADAAERRLVGSRNTSVT